MGRDGTFDEKLRRFYDECSDEERDVVAYMCVTTLATRSKFEARSDLGQKLQFQLTEANNIYTWAPQAQSDVSSKYHATLDAIAQNLRG